MADELFDLVDENNQPLGITKLRSLVHKDGDWHRTVHIFLINNQGQFLVHLRSPFKDTKPNRWDTRFGGHLKAGSTYESAALEELKEEIGLTVQLADLMPGEIYKYDSPTNREFSKVFYYPFNDDLNTLHFDDAEVVAVKWMHPEEIMKSIETNPDQWSGAGNMTKIHNYYLNHK